MRYKTRESTQERGAGMKQFEPYTPEEIAELQKLPEPVAKEIIIDRILDIITELGWVADRQPEKT